VGEFFDPSEPKEHHCPLPNPDHIFVQDGWRCDCGKAYVRRMLPERDVNPGESPWQWERSPQHDKVSA
jgi:hypothetical protein